MKHEFYSNVFSRVVTPERTLEGSYFRSDEQVTHYLVTNSKGSFVASDIEGDSQPAASSQPNDSAATPTVRPAATKHAISN